MAIEPLHFANNIHKEYHVENEGPALFCETYKFYKVSSALGATASRQARSSSARDGRRQQAQHPTSGKPHALGDSARSRRFDVDSKYAQQFAQCSPARQQPPRSSAKRGGRFESEIAVSLGHSSRC